MKRYSAVTLLELLIVMAIMFVLSTISVVVYRSLIDSFSINEASLTVAQDIRAAQRAAMLLDREPDERWLHGIGIDFRKLRETYESEDGQQKQKYEYDIFKWCSRFDYYDRNEASLTNEVPNLANNDNLGEVSLDLASGTVGSCPRGENDSDAILVTDTKRFYEYDNLEFLLEGEVVVILFEAVSGKAFFYNEHGLLLNYSLDGSDIVISPDFLVSYFRLEIIPKRGANLQSRILTVPPVSGIVYFELDK